MKFSCSREHLDKHLQLVGRVVTPRSTLPILSNLLIEVEKGRVRISGTDLELAVATSIEASVEQEGSFTVPAKLFQDFIHQNPDHEIQIKRVGNELLCTSGQVEAKIPGVEAEEFPPLPVVTEKSRISLQAKMYSEALKQVVMACAQDQGRPILTGVLVTFTKDEVTLAATDSFRLIERKLPGVPVAKEQTLILPNRTVHELLRILSQLGEDTDLLEVTLSDQQVVFHCEGVELFSRVLTGSFPKYHAIIPKEFPTVLTLDTNELTQALKLVTVFGQAGVANAILEYPGEKELILSSHASRIGGSKQKISVTLGSETEKVTSAYNVRFLLDAMSVAGSSEIQLHISGKTTALVIKSDDPTLLQLIMPIRLDV